VWRTGVDAMSLETRKAGLGASAVVLCALAALCEGIDLQAAGVAAAGIGREFKLSAGQLGTFFSGGTFGLFIGALIGGRLADTVGRKTVLAASVAMFGLFCLLTPLATDLSTLSTARLLTGLGLGGALPNLIALVSESSPPHRRRASVTLVYAGMPFGGGVISLISLLLPLPHWRWIFIDGGVLPLLLAPAMAFALPESTAFRQLQSPGAAAGGSEPMPPRGSLLAVFAGGRALNTVLLWVSFFLGLLMLYLLLNWLPTLLVRSGFTHAQASYAQIGFNIGGALAAWLIGVLLETRARNPSVVVSFVALPILFVLLAQAPGQLGTLLLIVFLLGCAVMASQAYLYAAAPLAYPTSIRGIGVGAAVAIGRIGSIVGPKLGGTLQAAEHRSSQLFMDLLPVVIAGSIAALLLTWRLHAQRAAVLDQG
jgi:MFS transporter, AAHS family, 3-hydroxyphenylpropionic acid transporter